MDKHEVAQALRRRLYKKGAVKSIVDAAPDALIIQTYVTCSGCKVQWVPDAELDRIIAESSTIEEFIRLSDPAKWPHSEEHGT